MPKVSVIIATYNRAAKLPQAIKSVELQTFKDWELVIVDDGSKDDTAKVVREFAARDSRVKYYFQANQGQSMARANGVSYATGEYAAFLDDDDIFYPDKLEKQVRFLDSHPEVALVYGRVRVIGAAGRLPELWPDHPARNFMELLWDCKIQPNAVLVRRRHLLTLGNFNTTMDGCDDYEMWLRVAKCFPIAFIDETVGTYVWHEDNMSYSWIRRCSSQIRIYKAWLKEDLTPEERKQVIKSAIRVTYWNAMDAVEARDFEKAAFYFWKAIEFNPWIGLHVSWSKYSNGLYRFIKPYAATLYFRLKAFLKNKSQVAH